MFKWVFEYQPLSRKSMNGIVFFTVGQRTIVYHRKGGNGIIDRHKVGGFESSDNVEDVVQEWTRL